MFNIYLSLTLGNFSDYEISELKTFVSHDFLSLDNDDDNNDNIFIHTIQVQGEKKKKKRKLQKNEIDIDYITICTIFESVCNSQGSKAFQLAAVYLQVKKGTQERNNNETN